MRSKVALSLVMASMALSARPACADVTAFIGANTSPANRQVRGFAVGLGVLVVLGFEFDTPIRPMIPRQLPRR